MKEPDNSAADPQKAGTPMATTNQTPAHGARSLSVVPDSDLFPELTLDVSSSPLTGMVTDPVIKFGLNNKGKESIR
jgi:hypothetical protein